MRSYVVQFGYHVRFDRKVAEPIGSINYCTTGILLEQIKHNPDEVFDSVSHLVIDEVHERDLNIDFLMIILKKAIRTRKAAGKSVPRVVLMSATLDTELFAQYFNQSTKPGVVTPCPSISVPGRTFPVKEKFLGELMQEMREAYAGQLSGLLAIDHKCNEYLNSENVFSASNKFGNGGQESVIDWNRQRPTFENAPGSSTQDLSEALVPVPLVAATLAHICNTSNDGAILAFLPGLDEILKTREILERRVVLGVNFMDTSKFKICTLHSSVSKEDQADVFLPVPPGCRKIILSTNIAETSVTIPDVQYVVDTGKLREKRYDQLRRITRLECTWVSKSNSKQRAGRAGRVQNGNYYALFTRERFEKLRAIGLPELLRSDLQETCLAIKSQSFDDSVGEFLSQSIEPPPPEAVDSAVRNLKAMEAFTQNEELTALGRLLAKLPIHPTLGKMVVLGVIFRCLDPLLILGAAAEERSMFLAPPGRRSEARAAQSMYYDGQQSDHIALLNAFHELQSIRDTQGNDRAWRRADQQFLHMGAFRNIDNTAKQLHDVLVEVGLVPNSRKERRDSEYAHPSLNVNSGNLHLIRGLLVAGLNPNLAVKKSSKGSTFRTASESLVIVHQSSHNRSFEREPTSSMSPPLLTYSTLSKADEGSTLSMRDTTLVDPLTCALFGSNFEHKGSNKIQIYGWVPFYIKAPHRISQRSPTNIISEFKGTLDLMLRSAFQSLSNLGAPEGTYIADDQVRELFARYIAEVLVRNAKNVPQRQQQHSQDQGTRTLRGPWNSQNTQGTMQQPRSNMSRETRSQEPWSPPRNNQLRIPNQAAGYATNSSSSESVSGGGRQESFGSGDANTNVAWWRDSSARNKVPRIQEKVANRWVVKQLAGYAGGRFQAGNQGGDGGGWAKK